MERHAIKQEKINEMIIKQNRGERDLGKTEPRLDKKTP